MKVTVTECMALNNRTIKITSLWDMTPCRIYPEDGGRMFLLNDILTSSKVPSTTSQKTVIFVVTTVNTTFTDRFFSPPPKFVSW